MRAAECRGWLWAARHLRQSPTSLSNTARAAVLVIDGSAVANGYVDGIGTALAESLTGSAHLERYVVPAVEPDASSVDAAAELVRSIPEAIVIGAGGGTRSTPPSRRPGRGHRFDGGRALRLGANPLPGHRPMVAIPTTAGTGAEVTRTCVVTAATARRSGRGATSCGPRSSSSTPSPPRRCRRR